MSDSTAKVSSLQAGMEKLALVGRVAQIYAPREVKTRYGPAKVATALFEDDTGRISLNLWDDQVDRVGNGDTVRFENTRVTEFHGQLELQVGRASRVILIAKSSETRQRFNCYYCDESFPEYSGLEVHLKADHMTLWQNERDQYFQIYHDTKELYFRPENYSSVSITHPSLEKFDLRALEVELGTSLQSKELFKQALTHDSYLNENPEEKAFSYERLEFLGDSVIQLAVSKFLYDTVPSNEGGLTDRRKELVNNELLAQASRRLRLERFIRVSQGLKVGPLPSSILADVFEALLGAVFLEKGFDKASSTAIKLMKL